LLLSFPPFFTAGQGLQTGSDLIASAHNRENGGYISQKKMSKGEVAEPAAVLLPAGEFWRRAGAHQPRNIK